MNNLRALATALVFTVSLTGCSHVRLQSPIAPTVGPPTTFVPSTSDAKTTQVFDVRDGFTKGTAFRAASDLLAQQYTVDVSDPHAGFLMTTWQASYIRDGVPDVRYRTRMVIRFLGDEWRQVSVRSEANWQRDAEWVVGYDTKMLDTVSAQLRAKIGKKN